MEPIEYERNRLFKSVKIDYSKIQHYGDIAGVIHFNASVERMAVRFCVRLRNPLVHVH